MITEDYVSFETAKLLKEKGFDWDCIMVYDLEKPKSCADGKLYDNFDNKNPNRFPDLCSAPSLAMAMKWLREVHKIALNIRISCNTTVSYTFDIWDFSIIHPNAFVGGDIDLREQQFNFKSYEEACEAAIKYCLTNLI